MQARFLYMWTWGVGNTATKTSCGDKVSSSVKNQAELFNCICIKSAFGWFVGF